MTYRRTPAPEQIHPRLQSRRRTPVAPIAQDPFFFEWDPEPTLVDEPLFLDEAYTLDGSDAVIEAAGECWPSPLARCGP